MPIKKTDKATPPTEIARRIRSLKRFFRATSNMGGPLATFSLLVPCMDLQGCGGVHHI